MAGDDLVPLLLLGAALFAVVIGSGIWMYRWQYRTADAKLQRWAQKLQYKVVDNRAPNLWARDHWRARATNK